MSEILNLKKEVKKAMECLEKAKRRQKTLINRESATIDEQERAQLEVAHWTRRLSTAQSRIMELTGITKEKY